MSRALNRYFNDPSCIFAEPLDEEVDLSGKGLSTSNAVIVNGVRGRRALSFISGSLSKTFGRPSVTRSYWFNADHYAFNGTDTFKNGVSGASEIITIDDSGFSVITGEVTALMYFDRALSAQEIQDIFNETTFDYNNSLVSLWEMDEINPRDKVGPNDGTGVSIVEADIVAGHNGRQKAIDFDGSADTIDLNAHAAKLNFVAPVTLAFWVKAETESLKVLFSFSEGSGVAENFNIFLGDGISGSLTNELITIFENVNNVTQQSCGYETADRTELYGGGWHLIALTSGGSAWRINLDGDEKVVAVGQGNTGTYGGNPLYDSCKLPGRQRSGSLNLPFNGDISSSRIFNAELTVLQLADLYAITRRI